MNKVLVFGASSSRNSINKRLAFYAGDLLTDTQITKIDLVDFEMPLFSIDRERESGIPEKAIAFRELVANHDGIVISFAEHNGAYSAVFKNLFDWISRIEGGAWADKPMLLLATSPGPRGGSSVLQIAVNRFPWNNGKVVASYSLPSFGKNFEEGQGILDPALKNQFNSVLLDFAQAIQLHQEEAV
jgi:NAD(P)H-dependent FMN reductase